MDCSSTDIFLPSDLLASEKVRGVGKKKALNPKSKPRALKDWLLLGSQLLLQVAEFLLERPRAIKGKSCEYWDVRDL